MSDLKEPTNLNKNDKQDNKKKNVTKEILEWILCIVIAIVLALIFRYFIATPTKVQKLSMFPTLKENDTLILNKFTKTMKKEPKRGDIITFEAPSVDYVDEKDADMTHPVAVYENQLTGGIDKFLYYGLDIGKTTYIKRVIGLPGDHVEIKDNKVYLNGEIYNEPYLDSSVITTPQNGIFYDLVVPDGYVFAMGDNRPNSKDCRHFGCVPFDKIEGTIWIRFWPLNKFGKIKWKNNTYFI